MNYSEALEYTHSLLRFGSRPGLERINALLEELGNPHHHLKVIHIAGTNGKGSVSSIVSKILETAGYKTALFISPYIIDFRERMQINSQYISENEYAELCTTVKNAAERLPGDLHPTEFELVTAIALLWFSRQKCDVAVFETGLGGRLDSTNVFEKPLATVITSISMDHMAVLGDSLSEIAAEKCGIIKNDCVVITSPYQPDEAMAVIKNTSNLKNALLIVPEINSVEIISDTVFGSEFVYLGLKIRQPLAGTFQIENTVIAIEAVKQCGLCVGDNDIVSGIKNVRHPARFEVISSEPLVILDGAHNVGGAKALSDSLKKYLGGKHLFGICGMLKDKEYEKALSCLTPLFDEIITVTPPNPRALSAHELKKQLESSVKKITTADVNKELIPAAVSKANGRPVIIFGSLYLAGEIYKYLEK